MGDSKNSNSGMGVLSVLGIVFIVLKLTGSINWSWWWVTLPFWGGIVLLLLVFLISFIIFRTTEKVRYTKKVKKQLEFWTKLKALLESKDLKLATDNFKKNVTQFKVKQYYKNQQISKPFGLWCEIYRTGDIVIYWGCAVEDNVYYGFSIEKAGKDSIANSEFAQPYRQIVSKLGANYKVDSENWLGWSYPTTKLNFRHINSIDQILLDEVAGQIAEKSYCDIEHVLEDLKKN